ncbi:WD40-repeat-containing domain protein, partial [Favolaschia claudopus]
STSTTATTLSPQRAQVPGIGITPQGRDISKPQVLVEIQYRYTAFSRDGQRAYWGSREGHLCSIDSVTGSVIHLEAGCGQGSLVAAISNDDQQVLVAGDRNSGFLCDANTGEVLHTLDGHSKRICQASFAPVISPRMPQRYDDGDDEELMESDERVDEGRKPERPHLATSSFDNTVRIWNVNTGQPIALFDDLGDSVNGVCWSPDATQLAITNAHVVRVYEVATGQLVCVLEGHTELVCNVAFSPNGQLLASASNDDTVRVWSIPKKTCIAVLMGPTGDTNDVEFSPDGKLIAAAADDGVWIWDVNEYSVYRTSDMFDNATDPAHLIPSQTAKKRTDKLQNMTLRVPQ